MTVKLSAEQSLLWEEGGCASWRIEEDVVELLIAAEVTEQVIVLLDTGAVAFAITPAGGVL